MMENDELERTLEAALSKYAAVEPRTGLEQRVLANLRAEGSKSRERAWWQWSAVAGFVAIIILAATWVWRPAKAPHAVVADHTSARPANHFPNIAPPPKEAPRVVSGRGNQPSPKSASPYQKTIRTHAVVEIAAPPKLDQFPSPRPLSEQEQILASYVVGYRQHAEFVVQARLEALRKDREEERKAAAGNIENSQMETNTN